MEYELVYTYQPASAVNVGLSALATVAAYVFVARSRPHATLALFLCFAISTPVCFLAVSSAVREAHPPPRPPPHVVEGVVRVHSTQPWDGHAPGDQIEVDGQRFEINYFRHGACYGDTIARGGVLREGARVRLGVRGRCIVRIELASL